MSVKAYRLLTIILLLGVANLAFGKPKATPTPKPKPLEIQTDQSLGFFIASRDETLGTIKKIGLLPPILPPEFEGREDVKAALLELATTYLTKAGLEVVQPTTYQAIYDRLNKQLGGIYNPDTGDYKAELGRALASNAQREFMEKEHLNGFVYSGIKMVEAHFYHSNVYWDGSTESSTGRIPPSEVAKFLWGDGNSTGTLPAYSVLIQIANSQDKIVFGRRGAIQLSNYYDPRTSKGANGFLYVPRESLFQDKVRLERAVRIATQPLVFTPTQIAAGTKDPAINPALATPAELPLPPEGKSRQTVSPFHTPREQILSSVHRVVVTPLDVGSYSVPEGLQDRYLALITAELQKLNIEIIQAPDAHNQLRAELRKAGGFFNPLTGKRDEDRINAIRKKAIQSLGVNPVPDAIIWATLSRSTALHKNDIARWDGVSQDAVTLGPVKRKNFWDDAPSGGEGSIRALSLNIQLRSNEDIILYQSRGGIQLLQQLQGTKTVDLAPSELFQDQTREQPAVHVALRDLVLSPEELDQELHPQTQTKIKAKKKKTND